MRNPIYQWAIKTDNFFTDNWFKGRLAELLLMTVFKRREALDEAHKRIEGLEDDLRRKNRRLDILYTINAELENAPDSYTLQRLVEESS